MVRTPACQAKVQRMNRTLRHQEADRVPISDFFWGSFLARWQKDLGLAPDTDVYRYLQSDHSVPGNISGQSYDYVVGLVREYGEYPLRLGEYDLPDLK
jgi:hypothetical protein